MNAIPSTPTLSSFSRIFSGSGMTSTDNLQPAMSRKALISEYQAKADSILISRTGRQMHLHIDRKDNADKPAVQWERITNGLADKTVALIDTHISKAGKIVERMKTLAEAAKDESLADIDRVELQMEMGSLQHELDIQTEILKWSIRSDFSGNPESAVRQLRGSFEDSAAYGMLQRTRERVVNGEEWDVAEIATDIVKINGTELEYVRTDWEITEDETIPTVGDILKAKGRSVMDAKSAALSALEMERDLAKLEERRDELISFIEKNGVNRQENSDDDSFIKRAASLAHKLVMFLVPLYREMAQTLYGPPKDEQGNYVKEAMGTTVMDASVHGGQAGSFLA
ncbi:MAG: hypothetical protein LBG29_04540 [Synergistaceae bacterium]|jgi:hypothetical protein|nr:hypothetical protein [Synergistaceae bacterium]